MSIVARSGGGGDVPYRHPEAERDAQAVLNSLSVVDLPVDPVSIARDFGIAVWTSILDDDVAGLLVQEDHKKPEIYLNASDHSNRQRFTCAHELGHFYQRRSSGDLKSLRFVDRRDDLASRGTDPREKYANAFAAALLMPEGQLKEYARSHDARGLASLFSVSLSAMNNRLQNVGLRGL